MATTTKIFTEKETNNWFKACIALNMAKEGLTNFVVTELKNVLNAVGISCGQCSIENLMPCPTQGLCNKRKPYKCTFHTSHQPKSCQSCDQVKQNIKSLHRFNGPSWRNSKAERWATDPWEIGKCYLPPDGYSDVSSVHDSDFNGVISILLNCTHFQACLSPACLSPPPPDKQCPLEKIRQIGRDVRHTADCKVTDADLQDYFKTLATFLADPICLLHETSATDARRKLSDLQNDRLSLTELGELLKEANQTITRAKEVGERLSKEAERTLTEGLDTLEATIQAGVQRVQSEIMDSIVRIKQAANEKGQDDFERGVADLLRRLKDHYRDTVSFVPLSTLDPSHDKQVHDIYASPKIHRMKIENGGRRTKQEQVLTYKDFFYRDNQLSRRTYLQGDAGSGKTTFVAKLVNDWCNVQASSMNSTKEQTALVDVDTLQKFKFVFFISLRDSRNQACVVQMIKTQLIDKTFADSEAEDAYKLVLQIMKTSTCLIIQDGLDEWPGEDVVPSMAGIPKDHCIVLTTSRPWKLTDERIRNSQIDILLDLEGISDPEAFNEKVLRCLLHESNDLKETVKQFKEFLRSHNLQSISVSPMLHALIICTWVEGIAERLSGSSLCELYTILLESLCKKANPLISHFNRSEPLPVNCFSRSRYIKPNMQHIHDISKAAFSFVFSNEREMSIVFNEIKLSEYLSDNTQEFALKSGLLSIRKRTNRIDNTCSFVHKSVQEFLAAFYISGHVDVINSIISGYLERHHDSYLDIFQVFVFLCGMNITAANELSELMNVQDIAQGHEVHNFDEDYFLLRESSFQRCVVSGYKEAEANKTTPVHLHLSHFCFLDDHVEDVYRIWAMNTSRARSLSVCHFPNKHLILCSQDASSARWKGLRSSLTRARDNPGPSASKTQREVNSSASFNLSLSHHLEQLNIVQLNLKYNVTMQPNALVGLKNLKSLGLIFVKCKGLDLSRCNKLEHLCLEIDVILKPNALVGLKKLNHLKLTNVLCKGLALSSCHNLERLILEYGVTLHPNALVGLKNLKYINIRYFKSEALAIDLSSCVNVEELKLTGGIIVRPNALIGMKKLKLLTLGCTYESITLKRETFPSVCLRNLLSTLLTSDHEVKNCGITSSEQCAFRRSLKCVYAAITIYLNNTIRITLNGYAFPVLCEAMHGLRIKSLSLGNICESLRIQHGTSFLQSLRSLSLLETLTMHLPTYIDIQLPQSLKHVTLFYNILSSSQLRDLVNKLSALSGPLDCRIEFPTEEYILIKEELKARERVKVKRFRIYDRSVDIDHGTTSAWSLRCDVVDDGGHSAEIAYAEFYDNKCL
ncbi:hypothetical protein DPMN_085528 [Dreissena polymorpha]|uniref:NACHT domain-containing protein n=1 Tax=Dreissena polymorpha TaxID=45954 RepID=A0A9D3YCW2_DREPO|nr:hypothetical protein DPMN_085528 [Dreissena polymorpha]